VVSGLYEVQEAGGTAGLIVPQPPHTPSGKVLTAQCIDGTSVAAPYPNHTSWSLSQQAGDIDDQSALQVGNRVVPPV
jgi:hypothetical protein